MVSHQEYRVVFEYYSSGSYSMWCAHFLPCDPVSYSSKLSKSAAQWFALLALMRAWIVFGSRKITNPEKCLKMQQNPQCPVHVVLGGLIYYYAFCSS
jgi:hypothetical protein